MYGTFTERARTVIQLANREAYRFNHEFICTNHILLGLLKLDGSGAAMVLKNLGIDANKALEDVESSLQEMPGQSPLGALPHEPPAKKLIEYAIMESRKLNHNHIGTIHVLLGLLTVESSNPENALVMQGLTTDIVRAEIIKSMPSDDARQSE
jgi:ATP-dependent Clp protease ATP-binding subunit ClpC